MKKMNRSLVYFLILGTSVVLSCKEESENIFTMFKDVHVTFNGDNPLAVTDYTVVNDKDSVYVDYTITSDKEDIYTVVEEKVGGANSVERTSRVITDEMDRRSYSRVLKLRMQRDGKTSYRIYALNQKGYYIGDGYSKVTIEVNPSYTVIPDRRIYAPDSVEKIQPSFFSISRGQSFSYTDGQANSTDIDFGIWRKVVYINSTKYTSFNYYSLSAPTNPFPIYDISTWEKRGTLFSAPITSGALNTFLLTLVSSSKIEEEAKKVAINVTATNYTPTATSQPGLVAGALVYFLTPEGKYGAFYVYQNTTDRTGGIPYLNISVKMQR